MIHSLIATALLASSVLASAIPLNPRDAFTLNSRESPSAVSLLLALAPLSSSCTGATYATECRTATQAAPYLLSAFATYSIYSPAAMAAILSTIAYESGDFEYNIHHFPSLVAGQGTRNMQSFAFNYEYANSITALQSPLAAIGGTVASMTADQMNEVLALVTPDEYSFASAAWFFTTQCSADVQAGVESGGLAGWETYLTACVGTSATDDRVAGWKLAATAFGFATS